MPSPASGARAATAVPRGPGSAEAGRRSAGRSTSVFAPVNGLHTLAGNTAVAALLQPATTPNASMLPAAVRDAVRAPGEPLDPRTRGEMEATLGSDLSSVRVHRDAAAASSADGLGALAYTAGSHVVFSAAAYRPHTREGRTLVLHELTHVLQQRDAAGRTQAGVSSADDSFERAARHAATSGSAAVAVRNAYGSAPPAVQREPKPGSQQPELPTMPVGDVKVIDPAELRKKLAPAELLNETIKFFNVQNKIYSGVKTVSGGDAQLGQLLRLWKRTLEVAIETLHDKLSDNASLTEQLKQAYAAAMGTILPVYAASLKRTLHEVLRTNRDDLHEWAWPADRPEPTANELSDAIPLADRKRIKVLTTQVIAPSDLNVDELFSTTGARVTSPLPEGVTAEFSGTIPETLRRGLSSVAGRLISKLSPPPLVLDTSISLAIDLGNYGGDYAMYRFTYFTHHAPTGPARKRLLIERVAALGMEGLRQSQRDALEKRLTDRKLKFRGSWKPDERDVVLEAVGRLPDAQLAMIEGATFERGGASGPDPKEAGHYDVETHTIMLVDKAFVPSASRFSVPTTQAVGFATHAVMHEIGHAIDVRKFRAANTALAAAAAALRSEFGAFETPRGSGRFENIPQDRMPRFNQLMADVTKARKGIDTPTTESGHKAEKDTITADPNAKTDFRAAVAKDGGVRTTPYSDESWAEAFAEAYTLYINEPDSLRRLRPAVFAFFTKNFPK